MINEDFSTRGRAEDVGRWYVTRFVEGVAKALPAGASILDAGAGEGVYKKYFSHCDYKSVDLAVGDRLWNYGGLDYVAPLHEMPIESSSFDAVLCTQVLEHLEWVRESVKEIHRVLKPGGKLYLTVPMAHNEHQVPYDFFRFTSYGVRSICARAGFREISVEPFGGIWARWAYELPRGLSVLLPSGASNQKKGVLGIVLVPVKAVVTGFLRVVQWVFLLIDGFDKKRDDPFGWSCVATK